MEIKDLLHAQVERRVFVGEGLAAVVGFLSGCVTAEIPHHLASPVDLSGLGTGKNLLSFKGVAMVKDHEFDSMVVAEGYHAEVFFSWGDPVENGAPEWKNNGKETWQDQLMQAGQNHDGMHFFAINGSSTHGLLVVNHENINQHHLHSQGPSAQEGKRPIEEVKKEQAAHGVSIIEVRKTRSGWGIISSSPYARRIHGNTRMKLQGPAAGSEYLKTLGDSTGTEVLGTLGNCAMGYTPWGTYLTCEENYPNYFANANKQDRISRREHHRYGVGQESGYGWETVDPRFDSTPYPQKKYSGYVNESNKFGWVVEIDPFNPKSKPIKRTAMGRFVRECATPSMAEDGRMAFYMGDDSKGEYIYKFVPEQKFQKSHEKPPANILDHGTLFVAVLHKDGSGEWKEIEFGKNGLTEKNGFKNQSDVLVNARSAADVLGATSMDRPEWVAVHPQNKDVYVTLTNNTKRGNGDAKQELNAANPIKKNYFGHILKMQEQGARPEALKFQWEIFLLGGERNDQEGKLAKSNHQDIFACPDGLYFDKDSRLWIQTDYNDSSFTYKDFGLNQMLVADPVSKRVKRFFVGPKGCEISGITKVPDGTSLFINVQHPKLSFPAGDGKSRPRSSTVVITKLDGGVVGT